MRTWKVRTAHRRTWNCESLGPQVTVFKVRIRLRPPPRWDVSLDCLLLSECCCNNSMICYFFISQFITPLAVLKSHYYKAWFVVFSRSICASAHNTFSWIYPKIWSSRRRSGASFLHQQPCHRYDESGVIGTCVCLPKSGFTKLLSYPLWHVSVKPGFYLPPT